LNISKVYQSLFHADLCIIKINIKDFALFITQPILLTLINSSFFKIIFKVLCHELWWWRWEWTRNQIFHQITKNVKKSTPDLPKKIIIFGNVRMRAVKFIHKMRWNEGENSQIRNCCCFVFTGNFRVCTKKDLKTKFKFIVRTKIVYDWLVQIGQSWSLPSGEIILERVLTTILNVLKWDFRSSSRNKMEWNWSQGVQEEYS
jgi:hypothetical protein